MISLQWTIIFERFFFSLKILGFSDFYSLIDAIQSYIWIAIGTRLTMEQELQLQQDEEEEEEEMRETGIYTFLRRPAVVYPMVWFLFYASKHV